MPRRTSFLRVISDVDTRTRGYIPHWNLESATYAVTFRLHGSLPREVVERLREERRARKSTALENMHLRAEFEQRVDARLHEQTDVAWMNDARIANIVARALLHFDTERYELHAWCVMPNHVHVVVTPLAPWTLAEIIHSWKSYSSTAANKLLGRTGKFWSREYFDRIIRDEEDLSDSILYVLGNPGKAGLENWRWTSTSWNA